MVRAGEKPLDRIITADANMFVSVSGISDLREAWEKHPLVMDLGEARMGEIFMPFLDESADGEEGSGFSETLEEFELDEEELFELFSGQVGLVVYNLQAMVLEDSDDLDIAILADFSGSEERIDDLMQIQFERNAEAQKEENPAMEHEWIREQFMGETLHFDQAFDGEETYIEDGYALVDGIFIIATPEERLRSMVESIKLGSDDAIAQSEAYRRVTEYSGPADIMFYLNFESFLPALNEAMVELAMEGGMAMLGVTGKSLDAALSLESLQAFSLSAKVNEASISSHSSFVYREKAGLLKLFTYGDGALPSASYVPEGILSSSVALFDMSEMFAELEALLGAASPSTPALINIQMQQIKTNTGVDLRSALLENFGPEFVTYSLLPGSRLAENAAAEAQQVYVFEIKDAVALSGALEALKDLIPGARAQIEIREFEGETIHTISTAMDPAMSDGPAYGVSFVVTRTNLIFSVGQSGLMQSVLTAMQSQGSGFWQQGEIQGLIELVGKPGPVSRSYTDLGQMMTAIFESIFEAAELAGSDLNLDASKMPSDLELPWHLLSETHEASDGIYTHMIMLRKEESR